MTKDVSECYGKVCRVAATESRSGGCSGNAAGTAAVSSLRVSGMLAGGSINHMHTHGDTKKMVAETT